MFTYTVTEGPQEGTYTITIAGEFTDLDVSGTVDGEPIDSESEISEVARLAGTDPIEVTVIVDEQGNSIVDEEPLEDPLADLAADLLGGVGYLGAHPGVDPGQFVGPALADEAVTVGDTWTEEIETNLEEQTVVTTVTSTVTGLEELDGTEVYVIETQTNTPPVEIDLAELFILIFTGFAEPEAMMQDLKVLTSIDATGTDIVTWFDAEAGVARKSTLVGDTHMIMDTNVPDVMTGEFSVLIMDITVDQNIEYRLISGPTD